MNKSIYNNRNKLLLKKAELFQVFNPNKKYFNHSRRQQYLYNLMFAKKKKKLVFKSQFLRLQYSPANVVKKTMLLYLAQEHSKSIKKFY